MIITRIGSSDEFNTVEITIGAPPAGSQAYQAELRVPDAGYSNRADFKVDLPGLKDLEDDAEAYGQELGKALFASDGLGPDYGKARAIAQDDHKGLHVRLVVEPPEMQALHWERIYQPVSMEWFPLASNADTPLSRWTASTQWGRPQPVANRPLPILAVIASPANLSDRYRLDPISAEERQRLHQILDGLSDVQVTYFESGTPAVPTLERIRQGANGYAFVHFLCHGAVTPGGAVLYLENADGSADPVNAKRLVETFQALSPAPALCFLSACESAVQDRHDAFLPLGPALVQLGGVQAAVAMSDKVGLDTAQVFASQFYTRLLVHGLVDKAVNEARAMVRDRWDWGVPVLFSRIEDNQLLDFPLDMEYVDTVHLSGGAANAARSALAVARGQNASLQNIRNIEDLIVELDKSQKFLGELAGNFQATGEDTDTFQENFQKFYQSFKPMYYGQTWIQEKISCQRVEELGQLILADMQSRPPPSLYESLKMDITRLYGSDSQYVRLLNVFLGKMNDAVDGIHDALRKGNVEAAIEQKINFEEQFERMLRKGKKHLDGMLEATHGARAA